VPFSSLMFFERRTQSSIKHRRLRYLILFALRSLLFVLLALAFWTWMWGPFGAFLAVPLSIVGLVVFNHLFPTEDVKLPD